MYTKEEILKQCTLNHSNPTGVIGLFSKKTASTRLQIPCVVEFYIILESILSDEISVFMEGSPVENGFRQGVYFFKNKMLVCLDIEPNTIQYLTYWTTGILRESKHFTCCSGTFLFTFDFYDEVFIPHIYSYFVIDKSLNETVPILSLTYLEDHRENLDFVNDGLNYLKDVFEFDINTNKTQII